MLVGDSGLGKSTLVNSLFLSDLYADRKIPRVEERVKRTTEIQKTTMEIEEKGVKLRLTVVDTPGFGDGLEGNGSWKACVKYVDDQFAAYFEVIYVVLKWSVLLPMDENENVLHHPGREWSQS